MSSIVKQGACGVADDHDTLSDGPVLESPPMPEVPVSSSGQLFAEAPLAIMTAKVTVVESFFRLLTRDHKFQDFTRELLLSMMKIVKCEAGSILEFDQRNKAFFFRAVVGQSSDRVAKFVIPAGQGIVGYVAESKQPLVVSDVAGNQIHLKSIEKAVGFETRNLVALPIMIRGKVFGVLELLNRVGENTFSPGDVELLTYFCEMAAKAIEVRLMLAWVQQNKHGKGEAA